MLFRKRIVIDMQAFDNLYEHTDLKKRITRILRDLSAASKMDGWDINNMDENDLIFKPKNRYEQEFWEKSRELSKNDAIRQHKTRKTT